MTACTFNGFATNFHTPSRLELHFQRPPNFSLLVLKGKYSSTLYDLRFALLWPQLSGLWPSCIWASVNELPEEESFTWFLTFPSLLIQSGDLTQVGRLSQSLLIQTPDSRLPLSTCHYIGQMQIHPVRKTSFRNKISHAPFLPFLSYFSLFAFLLLLQSFTSPSLQFGEVKCGCGWMTI